ncbi:MAG: glycosyltransferase family 87 protein [Pseudomonadota bacterium]
MTDKSQDDKVHSPALSTLHRYVWALTGLALIVCQVALAWISKDFGYERPLSQQPVVTMVGIELATCGVFLIALWETVRKQSDNGAVLSWIVCVGVFMRGAMFVSVPMLEDDHYRYLWDGGVLANGVSPYVYSPRDVMNASEIVPSTLVQLAHESGDVISRVSFPELRTIYPPVAQAFFALAYMLHPWSQLALRVVLSFFDGVTLVILLFVLRSLNLPRSLVAVYWWNPLILKEIFNTTHLDVISLPFALAAILLSTKSRHVCAAVTLAFAVAAKLWPLVFLPTILRPLWREPRRLLVTCVVFGLVSGILFLPVFMAGLDTSSGFVAYGRFWEMNDAAYRLISWGVEFVLAAFSMNTAWTQILTRLVTAVTVALWAILPARAVPTDSRQVWDRCLLIVAAVFLLSPTGFPWYFSWVVPFLAINPRPSLLLMNCMLFLYYLVYYYRACGTPQTFDNVIIWAEYLPFWGLAAWEWVKSFRRAATQ